METEINGAKETAKKSACTNMANWFLTKIKNQFNSKSVGMNYDQHFTVYTQTCTLAHMYTSACMLAVSAAPVCESWSIFKELNYKGLKNLEIS